MNVCAAVTGCAPDLGGVRVTFIVALDDGRGTGSDAVVDLSRSTVQLNNDILDQVKRVVQSAFGVTLGVQDTVKLFGGAVL